LCHLAAPAAGIDVIGASFPGIPGVVIGRNARIAWGVTNTGVDVQDLYVMQNDPASPDGASYIYDGVSRPYDVRTEVIDVKGGDAESLLVRTSVHGPVVTSDALGSGIVGDDAAATRAVLCLRWASVDPTLNDTTFSAFYGLQRAANWMDFRAALALWFSPSQNVVYADVDGNIGYQMPGFVPTRNLAAGHSGAWPAPGNSSAFAWRTPWPYDALPRTFNPPRGFVASANNQVPPRQWPFFLSSDYDAGSDGYRAERITDLLTAQPQHSPATFARIQTDYVSLFPRDVGRAVAGAAPATPGGVWLRTWLAGGAAGWDFSLPVGSWQATVWADLRLRLMALGAGEAGGGGFYDNPVFLLAALASDGSAGGTDAACPRAGFASCAAFAGAALDAAAAKFGIGGGGPPAAGASIDRWGEAVHAAAVTHQVLGGSPLACLADRAVAHGGEDYTINVGGYDFGDAAKTQTHGPSVRHIMALSDAANAAAAAPASLWMQPLGQEGDILRPSYDGLLARWAAGTYMVMSAADDASGGLITLSPA
jgi:penicillin amidase